MCENKKKSWVLVSLELVLTPALKILLISCQGEQTFGFLITSQHCAFLFSLPSPQHFLIIFERDFQLSQ